MSRIAQLRSAAVLLPFAALWASSASGHIEMQEPAPRYDRESNKACPCGAGNSRTVCDTPAEQSSDPNRSQTVTQYEVGSVITVRFEEYINHAGRFRVAFDDDGADLVDFNDNVLADIPDPDDNGGAREIEITLPDTPCNNCTLQLIQAMHGDTVNPVDDPAPLSTYYTCADIQLVPVGQLGQDPDPVDEDPEQQDPLEEDPVDEDVTDEEPTTDSTDGMMDGSNLNEPTDSDLDQMVDSPSDNSGATPDANEAAAGGTPADPNLGGGMGNQNLADTTTVQAPLVTGGAPIEPAASSNEGGCSISSGRSGTTTPWSVAGLLALMGLALGRSVSRRRS